MPVLRQHVASKLALQWLPEQVPVWLRAKYADDKAMQVSHETICKSLFIQARGLLKKELTAHLRSNRTMRRAKSWKSKGQPRGRIIDAVSILDHPADVEDKAVSGHWEGDLISGRKNTHIAALVERKSRYITLVKLDGKDTLSVINGL